MWRQILYTTVALTAAIGIGRGQGAPSPDLSGTWQLDLEASRFTLPLLHGGGDGGPADTLHITHAANGTLVVGNEVNAAKAWAYQLDASSAIPVGEGDTIAVRSWWEGGRFVSEGSREPPSASAIRAVREVRSLSEDGRTLTVEVTTTRGSGQSSQQLIYQRVP